MSLESSVTELVEQASELIDVFNQRKTEIEQAIDDAFSAAPSKLTSSISYTVGPGGNFETINAALVTVKEKLPGFGQNGSFYRVTLKLLSGFVMQEQVLIDYGVDFSFVRIESEDEEVSIDPDYLTNYFWGRYPVFGAARFSKLPVIDVLFNFLDKPSKSTAQSGVLLRETSYMFFMPGAGIKNAGGRAVDLNNFCIAMIDGTDFSGAGEDGLYAFSSSKVACTDANFDGANGYALRLSSSHVVAYGISAIGCLYGVRLDDRASASLEYANISGIQTGEGIFVRQGSIVNASNVNVSGAAATAVLALEGSIVNVKNADLSGAGGYGVSSREGAIVIAAGANASGSASGGIYAYGAGRVMANDVDAQIVDGVDGSSDFIVSTGGMIWNYNGIGGTNVTKNTLVGSGIIFGS